MWLEYRDGGGHGPGGGRRGGRDPYQTGLREPARAVWIQSVMRSRQRDLSRGMMRSGYDRGWIQMVKPSNNTVVERTLGPIQQLTGVPKHFSQLLCHRPPRASKPRQACDRCFYSASPQLPACHSTGFLTLSSAFRDPKSLAVVYRTAWKPVARPQVTDHEWHFTDWYSAAEPGRRPSCWVSLVAADTPGGPWGSSVCLWVSASSLVTYKLRGSFCKSEGGAQEHADRIFHCGLLTAPRCRPRAPEGELSAKTTRDAACAFRCANPANFKNLLNVQYLTT